MDVEEKVKNLPSTPGVYLMKDRQQMVIYVGKSKNLKKRVQSYFYQSKGHSPKIKKLVSTIHDIDTINTDTEFEAFMLECKLIRVLKPYFNRKMKNPKSYSYIIVKMDRGRRTLETSDQPLKGNLHFGPFNNKYSVQRTIQGIKEVYKIECSGSSSNTTPCLNHSMGLCIGVCLGGPALDEHNRIIDSIISLLNGTDMRILEEMELMMQDAATRFDFETAAKIRDSLEALNFLLNKEKVIEFAEENQNIAVIEDLDEATIKFFLIKGNKVLYSEKCTRGPEAFLKMAGIIATQFKHNAAALKITRDDIDEAQIIYRYLKSSQCCAIVIPEDKLEDENFIKEKFGPF